MTAVRVQAEERSTAEHRLVQSPSAVWTFSAKAAAAALPAASALRPTGPKCTSN